MLQSKSSQFQEFIDEQNLQTLQQHTFYQEQIDLTQTPRFYSEINMDQIKQNDPSHKHSCLNRLLQGFRSMGMQIQQAEEHQLGNNIDSQGQEYFLQDHSKSIKETLQTREEQLISTFNQSIFFVNSTLLKNIREKCISLKRDLLILPTQIQNILFQAQQIINETKQNIMRMAAQLISKSLEKVHEQMDEILKNQQSAREQNYQLRAQLQKVSKEYLQLKRESSQLMSVKQQYYQLQQRNQEQAELIKELQEKIYELQYKVKQSQTNCSSIQSDLIQSNLALQKKYQKCLQEMRVALTHQIKVQMYYKLKYGYSLQFESSEGNKISHIYPEILERSNSIQSISEVINSIKEINECLLEKSKIFT